MSIIEKSIRKRGNQKLAAPIYTNTSLAPTEVVSAIKKLCEKCNQDALAELAAKRQGNILRRLSASATPEQSIQYYVTVKEKQVLIGYARTPERIINDQRRRQGTSGHWLAAVTFPAVTAETPAGQNIVKLQLLKWVINNNGVLQSRDKYLQFADALHGAVSVDGR